MRGDDAEVGHVYYRYDLHYPGGPTLECARFVRRSECGEWHTFSSPFPASEPRTWKERGWTWHYLPIEAFVRQLNHLLCERSRQACDTLPEWLKNSLASREPLFQDTLRETCEDILGMFLELEGLKRDPRYKQWDRDEIAELKKKHGLPS